MKRRILLDCLNLTDKRPKGVHMYLFNLLKQLGVIDSDFEFTVLIPSGKSDFGLSQAKHIHYERIRTGHPILWRFLNSSRYVKERNFDLMHFTTEGTVLSDMSIPYVLTAHESIRKYYKYSENQIPFFDAKRKITKILRLGLRQKMLDNARGIIAISESVKSDLIDEYGLREDKVRVIYYGVDKIFFSDDKKNQRKKGKPPYILIFATGDRRENISCELRAFARIKNKINHRLFIVGIPDEKLKDELTKLSRNLNILDRIEFFKFLSNKEVISFYRNADLYVDMSFLEGFGLQILEAMASSLPVIASNIDSVPEVAGNAGILINPDDETALANEILGVLKDNRKKEEMSNNSRARAREFSWRKTAEETLKAYDEAICRRFQ